jgi:hypothetical protein
VREAPLDRPPNGSAGVFATSNHDIVASDDHVVALSTIRWRRNDNNETFEDHVGQVFYLDGGRVLEVWTIGEDLAGFDRFLEGASG